jgi:NAD(P)-dependent dehydrogenase (short-subunit alcohol dehydrogenase family)
MGKRDRLHDLEVLVVGIEDMISRDVVRSLVEDGAIVTAAAGDERTLAHLQRDLGLFRTAVNIAQIDLSSASEMRLFADNLRAQGKLPHIVICCRSRPPLPTLHALSQLQPSLLLDALPPARTWLGRAVAGLNAPTLPGLLERARRPGLFDADAGQRRVVISRHVFTVTRWDAAPGKVPARRPATKPSRASPPAWVAS